MPTIDVMLRTSVRALESLLLKRLVDAFPTREYNQDLGQAGGSVKEGPHGEL